MKTQNTPYCPDCHSTETAEFRTYHTVNNGGRLLYICKDCERTFSETAGTPMEDIKSPISKVASALKIRSEGNGLRATGRILDIDKKTVAAWEQRLADQKETLMLYSFCHKFVSLVFEGDELYTIVNKRTKKPAESKGWTAVIMERGSRFIAEQQCGARNAELFESVMHTVCEYIEQIDDFTFLSDGERRYGNALLSFCAETLRTGKQQGRARKVLPPKVKVRIKNKGNRKNKNGRNLLKYQAPIPELPDTNQDLSETDIHANHVEAYNASPRRRNSAFRRRANTYAKTKSGLQRTLDVHMLIHNFVRPHWTTGEVPAVALGIFRSPLGLESILKMQQYA